MRAVSLLASGLAFALATAIPLVDRAVALQERQSTADSACSDLHIIIARGSYEAEWEGMMGTIADSICNQVSNCDSYGIHYPAVMGSTYVWSESSGAQAMVQAATSYAASCPQTPMVLMGYSQGAQVVADAFCGTNDEGWTAASGMSTSVTDQVIAVIQMGDPSFHAGLSYDVGTATQNGVVHRTNPLICLPYASKMQSYCDAGDPYCASGNDIDVHHSYRATYSAQAVSFVLAKYASLGRSNALQATTKAVSTTPTTAATAATVATPTTPTTTHVASVSTVASTTTVYTVVKSTTPYTTITTTIATHSNWHPTTTTASTSSSTFPLASPTWYANCTIFNANSTIPYMNSTIFYTNFTSPFPNMTDFYTNATNPSTNLTSWYTNSSQWYANSTFWYSNATYWYSNSSFWYANTTLWNINSTMWFSNYTIWFSNSTNSTNWYTNHTNWYNNATDWYNNSTMWYANFTMWYTANSTTWYANCTTYLSNTTNSTNATNHQAYRSTLLVPLLTSAAPTATATAS